MSPLALVLALTIAAHPAPTATPSAATIRAIGARNEAAYLVWRCANDRAFRVLHAKGCALALKSTSR